MRYEFEPSGTCSRHISFEVDDNGIIGDVSFTGGCHGNLQGVAALVKGRKAVDVIGVLKDIRCGSKMTSCPAQFARALTEVVDAK